jgi:Flp pilus assembly protein TadG
MNRAGKQQGQRGTSTLEFVVVLPTLLLVFFAIMELSRAWLTVNIVTTASREGARTGVVTPLSDGSFNPAPAESRIDEILAAANLLSGSSKSVTCAAPCGPGSEVQANVQVTFDTVMPLFLPMLVDLDINRTTTMRYE